MSEITLSQFGFSYENSRPVLQNVSFAVEPGECVGLIGPNGAGKSTLLKLLVGLLEGHTGTAAVQELPVNRRNMAEIRRRVGYLFQDSENQLFLSTVWQDVAFGPQNYGLPPAEVEQRVRTALQQVQLEELADRPVYKLSGGQKKLAAIATLLSMQPDIILMDEPSVALDPRNRRNLIRIIKELPGAKLIASHDLDMIHQLCSRTVLLSGGQVAAAGPTGEILADEALLLRCGL